MSAKRENRIEIIPARERVAGETPALPENHLVGLLLTTLDTLDIDVGMLDTDSGLPET